MNNFWFWVYCMERLKSRDSNQTDRLLEEIRRNTLSPAERAQEDALARQEAREAAERDAELTKYGNEVVCALAITIVIFVILVVVIGVH
jgi:hypothetical protein